MMHTGVPLPPNPMEELEKNLQQAGKQHQLTKKERRQLKKLRKQEKRKREQRKRMMKKILNIGIIVLVVGGTVFGLGLFISKQPYLPPTTIEGHIEKSPPSHILTQPIPENIQKHMLEHADGRGRPGVIIQYNCSDFDCEPDLIQKLTDLVKQYPDNVYLAPNNYDGKIILTKLGKREILDSFDEQAIKNFIEK